MLPCRAALSLCFGGRHFSPKRARENFAPFGWRCWDAGGGGGGEDGDKETESLYLIGVDKNKGVILSWRWQSRKFSGRGESLWLLLEGK